MFVSMTHKGFHLGQLSPLHVWDKIMLILFLSEQNIRTDLIRTEELITPLVKESELKPVVIFPSQSPTLTHGPLWAEFRIPKVNFLLHFYGFIHFWLRFWLGWTSETSDQEGRGGEFHCGFCWDVSKLNRFFTYIFGSCLCHNLQYLNYKQTL